MPIEDNIYYRQVALLLATLTHVGREQCFALKGGRPISELLSPRFVPLAATFESQFRGMTLQEVSLQELEEARQRIVQLMNNMLTPAHRKFLIGFKQGEPDWSLLLSVNGAESLPGVQWKLLNIRRMTPSKRKEALRKLEIVLLGEG